MNLVESLERQLEPNPNIPELHPGDTINVHARIVEGAQEAFLIQSKAMIEGQPGDTVSLIPLGGDAEGVTTVGLEWPLTEDTLRFGPARGVSNMLTAEQASVRVRCGSLLCIVMHISGK